jgi:hypothetical protein
MPFCVEKILRAQHASFRTTGQHCPDALQCSRKIQSPLQTQIEKTACNRSDVRATPSERGLNKETREALYGKAVVVYRPDALSLRPDAA